MKQLVFLAVIVVAVFGAGAVDVLFPDVIPLRPYTGIFLTVHQLTANYHLSNALATALPLLAIAVLILVSVSLLVPHFASSLIFLPLGARGSHSRANRRASGAGWKDTSQKQPLSADEQFRILMEVFGKPRVVILYDKQGKAEIIKDGQR